MKCFYKTKICNKIAIFFYMLSNCNFNLIMVSFKVESRNVL